MNGEKPIRDFYEEEAAYENSIKETKELVSNVLKIDKDSIVEKINFLESLDEYRDFKDLFEAVVGNKTNKYYYCKNENDIKYYGLLYGEVYKMSELNPDIQTRNRDEVQLNLQARAKLAEQLKLMLEELIELFKNNIEKNDGSFVTIDSKTITEKDVEDLQNVLSYSQKMIDEHGRLKILVAERDVFAFQQAKIDYSKKTLIEKWFHKAFKREDKVIDEMAAKRK